MTAAAIRLETVTKTFDGHVVAVDAVTLDIAAGEFLSVHQDVEKLLPFV